MLLVGRLLPNLDAVVTDPGRVDPAAAVVVGDSQAVGLDNCGIFDRLGTATHGISGRSIEDTRRWISTHPSAIRGRALVYLQVGGNDLGSTPEEITQRYVNLLTTVRNINPRARIVLGTIPVRGEWLDTRANGARARLERTLNAVNDWILAQGNGPGGFTAFDVNAIISDPRNHRNRIDRFERRGRPDVHLNRLGYSTVAEAFVRRFFIA